MMWVLDAGTSLAAIALASSALIAAKAVAEGECDKGIIICGTGIGISIAANKVKGIRCARVNNLEDAKSARIHNHANVIAIPASLEEPTALEIIEDFLTTEPSLEERHQRRVNKIINYEKEAYNEL